MSTKINLWLLILYIQLHWQFLITFSDFRFVKIILRKLDTSSKKHKKEIEIIKTKVFGWKTTKNAKKIIHLLSRHLLKIERIKEQVDISARFFQKCKLWSDFFVIDMVFTKFAGHQNLLSQTTNTAQKIKFYIKGFFRTLRIWSHLLKKSLMENFIFCAV